MEREELLMDPLREMFQRRWALDKTVWRQAAEDLNPTELRCIEYLGSHANANATRLAESFFLTTGATSKLTKMLPAKGFLVRYQKEKNRKEVDYRLTEEGERIYTTVSNLRRPLSCRDVPFFETMDDEEYNTILHFAQRYDDYLRRMEEQM